MLADNQGSIRDVVNSGGTVLDHLVYDSYGNVLSQSDSSFSPRYAFAGRELDAESGMYYNRRRYYDPSTGDFISQDPIGFDGGDDNLYRYVNNDPANKVDPTGFVSSPIGDGARPPNDVPEIFQYEYSAEEYAGNPIKIGDHRKFGQYDYMAVDLARPESSPDYVMRYIGGCLKFWNWGSSWIPKQTNFIVTYKLSFSHYEGAASEIWQIADAGYLHSYTSEKLKQTMEATINDYKYFYIEQFGVAVAAEMVGGVLRLRSAVSEVKSQVGGVGPASDWHPCQLGDDFSGRQAGPIKGPGGTTVKEGVMNVVPRPGMQHRILYDLSGRPVYLFGQGEFSSSTTEGHYATMMRHVEKLAATGEYKYFLLQRSWRTATDRIAGERLIPDIIGVRRNDVVDAWEVASKSDYAATLRAKLARGMESLPAEYRGKVDVLTPPGVNPE